MSRVRTTEGESQAGWKLHRQLWGARLVDSGHGKGRRSASPGAVLPAGVTTSDSHSNTAASITFRYPSASKASQGDMAGLCFCQLVRLPLPKDGAASSPSLPRVTDGMSRGIFLFLCSLLKAIELKQSHCSFVSQLLTSEFCF